ncbi:MAG: AbrB/MazE/SpoVT family DNA-binding domain-containing protein [Burkholderiales bacterium]|nr:AbrB/MazE/SpoVT family DNA-binding domain-containing protein [Burkholderiales bacterium]
MSNLVTSKGQVTIPKRVRDALGIKAGSAVEFELRPEGEAVLVPVRGAKPAKSRFAKLRGTATVKMSTREIMALTRG